MMILRSRDPSPYGRMTKMAAHMTGTIDRIKVEIADTTDPADSLRKQNPLGKIPTLILEDGTALYDSRVICEYLDSVSTGVKLFPQGSERFGALTRMALGIGLMDAALLLVYEKRYRPEDLWHGPWLDMQQGRIDRTLSILDQAPPVLPKAPDIGHVALAVALGYLDVRFDGAWRESYRQLEGWHDAFAEIVPAYGATTPQI